MYVYICICLYCCCLLLYGEEEDRPDQRLTGAEIDARKILSAAAKKKKYRGVTHSGNALHTCGAFTECVTPFNGLKGL